MPTGHDRKRAHTVKTIILQRPEWRLEMDGMSLTERLGHQCSPRGMAMAMCVSDNPRWPEVLMDEIPSAATKHLIILMGNVYYSPAAMDRIVQANEGDTMWFMGRPDPRHGHCSELFAMGGPVYLLRPAVQKAVRDGAFRLWDIYAAYNDMPTRFSTCPEVCDNLIIQDDETEDFFSDDDVKAWQGYRYEAQQMAESHRLWTTHGMYTRHVINKMKREAK